MRRQQRRHVAEGEARRAGAGCARPAAPGGGSVAGGDRTSAPKRSAPGHLGHAVHPLQPRCRPRAPGGWARGAAGDVGACRVVEDGVDDLLVAGPAAEHAAERIAGVGSGRRGRRRARAGRRRPSASPACRCRTARRRGGGRRAATAPARRLACQALDRPNLVAGHWLPGPGMRRPAGRPAARCRRRNRRRCSRSWCRSGRDHRAARPRAAPRGRTSVALPFRVNGTGSAGDHHARGLQPPPQQLPAAARR